MQRIQNKSSGRARPHCPISTSAPLGPPAAPSARGKGIGTAVAAALVRQLATVQGIRLLTAVTGAENTASRRLLERQGFHFTGPLPGTGEVRYTLSLS